MFTEKDLKKLIVPLVIEQILAVAMGMFDTLMVASCGESAVSGISLVDTISVLLLGLFAAMASGGSVVVAQYIGKGDREDVGKASNQLFLAVGGLAVFLMIFSLLFNRQILSLIYGELAADVMSNARIYFYLSALSYPFIGIYNSGAALFRAVGNSAVSMQVSLVANVLNVAGNALLIYGFGLGVAGAGISTLCSRILSAIVICILMKRKKDVPVNRGIRIDPPVLRQILYIGVPNGLENSIFQIGKILLSSLIASFGTVAITANAVIGSVGSFQLIPSTAVGIAMITVVGQCVGAGEPAQARRYVFRLLRTAYKYVIIVGVVLIVFSGPLCRMYHLSEETTSLTRFLLIYNCICCMLVHPVSFPIANGLRAANDVKYTMLVSIISMWTLRVVLAYILGRGLGLGLFGVWIAMTADWAVRAIFFVTRIVSGRWEKHMKLDL